MFQQTVNLRDKMEKERQERLAGRFKTASKERAERAAATQNANFPAGRAKEEKPAARNEFMKKESSLMAKEPGYYSSKAQAIDQVYGDSTDADDVGARLKKREFQKISRPAAKEPVFKSNRLKYGLVSFLAIAVAVSAYFNVQAYRQNRARAVVAPMEARWYSVKLTNGDVFYGKIADTTADPVVLSNVYYDYDQMNKPKDGAALPEKSEPGNLRLVKRGKEAHGPDGTLDIVRAQVVYMEPLADNSKVLKAITENEK